MGVAGRDYARVVLVNEHKPMGKSTTEERAVGLGEDKKSTYPTLSEYSAPLKAAEDAVVVDTTSLNFDESFALLCELVINTLAMDRKD